MVVQEDVNTAGTYVRYGLDDGTHRRSTTGKLLLKDLSHWQPVLVPDPRHPGLPPIRYINLTGILESFKGINSIRMYSLKVVTDPHEVYFHALEVMRTEVYLEKGLPVCSPTLFQRKPLHFLFAYYLQRIARGGLTEPLTWCPQCP